MTQEIYTVDGDPKTSHRPLRVNLTTVYRLATLEEAEQQGLAARAELLARKAVELEK
jgi:hypothetical protein